MPNVYIAEVSDLKLTHVVIAEVSDSISPRMAGVTEVCDCQMYIAEVGDLALTLVLIAEVSDSNTPRLACITVVHDRQMYITEVGDLKITLVGWLAESGNSESAQSGVRGCYRFYNITGYVR